MKKCIALVCSAYFAVSMGLSAGCESKPAPAPTTGPSATRHTEGDGHDHGEEGEHHEGDGHDHEHASEGPHGGHLIELGKEDYHAELVHDEDTHTVGIYLLDSSAKQPVAVAMNELALNFSIDNQPKRYTLPADPLPEDAEGSSSRFQAVDEELCDVLCGEEEAKGRFNVTIEGKQFVGNIEHHEHEGHEHDHDK